MIVWFTGQPGHGKSTLLHKLKQTLISCISDNKQIICIDGDSLRRSTDNNDYTVMGRSRNVSLAQSIAKYHSDQGNIVLVSVVAPSRDAREIFKLKMGSSILEVYVCKKQLSIREHYRVDSYKEPQSNYLHVDTDNEIESDYIKDVINQIHQTILININS